jgi:hypothetical protein
MAHKVADRISDTTTTSGTGDITVSGTAPTGYQTPSAVLTSNGDTFDAVIVSGSQWEVTRLTRVSANVYSRLATPYASSTGSLINFTGGGAKDVWGDVAAFFARHLNTVSIQVASAATCDIGAVHGLKVSISGTTTITSFGTAANQMRMVYFEGILKLTHNATSLILPGAVDITTAGGDTAIFMSDASGNWTLRAYTPFVGFPPGYNYVINGMMEVDQRGASLGIVAGPALAYTADRWGSFAADATTWAVSQIESGVPARPKALFIQRTAGNANTGLILIGQAIESKEARKLAGKQCTLSFWSSQGANFSGGSVAVYVFSGTGTDEPFISGVAAGYTGSSLLASPALSFSAYKRHSVTFTVPTGCNELCFDFRTSGAGTAGAADWFLIHGVKLEVGGQATSLDERSYAQELALCQRYYFQSNATATQSHNFGVGVCYSTTQSLIQFQTPVPMRIAPTLSYSAVGDFRVVIAGTALAATGISIVSAETLQHRIDFTVASGLTAGQAALIDSQSSSAKLKLSAEL